MSKLHRYLFREVDASSLAVFRMGFGLIMVFEVLRYLFKFCISCFWNEPDFLFKYWGFGWVHPLPAPGMHLLWVFLGLAAVGITLGWRYRLCMVTFTVAFIYSFLQDQALYLNHFYLVILFAVLMCFVPAHHYLSLDARRRPNRASRTVPFWPIFLLGAQLELVLIWAGVVKINPDWLNLEPLRTWLSWRDDLAIVGPLFTRDWAVAVAAYGVIALHLVGAPLLLLRRTRLVVLCIYAAFHVLNHFVFNIGIFPWFTLFASLLLFDPDWPKQVFKRLRRAWPIFRDDVFLPVTERFDPARIPARPWPVVMVTAIAVWLSLQVLVPLRHWVIPGDVAWNEAGHRFSWRMKLRDKEGEARFVVRDPDGDELRVSLPRYLSRNQAEKMVCTPDMLLQFAHHIGDDFRARGFPVAGVYADVFCSLNGRPMQRFVEPAFNLYAAPRRFTGYDWVLPLTTPLPDPWLGGWLERAEVSRGEP